MGLLGHGNQKDDMPIHIIKCKINNKFAARFLLYYTKVCFEKKLDQHFVGHPHEGTLYYQAIAVCQKVIFSCLMNLPEA